MTRTRAAGIWAGLFLVALIVGGLSEDGLPVRPTHSTGPSSEGLLRLAERVRESWSATRNAQDQQCARGTLTGVVTYVRDGDTIEVGGMPIRLNGIAAPEANEPGGDAATAAMRAMVHGRELRCQLNGRHTYDRCVGVCYLDGEDMKPPWCAADSPETAPGTPAASTAQPSARRPPKARRSGGRTRCRATAAEVSASHPALVQPSYPQLTVG